MVRSPLVAIGMALALAALLGGWSLAQEPARMDDGVTCEPIWPSETDAPIQNFGIPHWVYLQKDIVAGKDPKLPADRHTLLLWIPGTAPPGSSSVASDPHRLRHWESHELCIFAANLGYHVISLSYSNALSASCCNDDSDPDAFEKFRLAIIEGGTTPHITVSRTDSIENRLIKLLQLLATREPGEGWDAFLTPDNQIRWEKIAVAGQSQGGGHAALIGVHYPVQRVTCFSAPKDFSTALNAPAAWYSKPSATSKDRFFAFNNDQDRQGCTPEQQLANLAALKLDQFGPPAVVDNLAPPYNHSHILMTDFPGKPTRSSVAHASVIDPHNIDLFGPVWRYMLTEGSDNSR